ncbi:MAG TPA: polysaccharide deacetylase family protein [Bacillota bacterium]|nr:polysaccharide deacetylase family protein [Bacillota bacterium]
MTRKVCIELSYLGVFLFAIIYLLARTPHSLPSTGIPDGSKVSVKQLLAFPITIKSTISPSKETPPSLASTKSSLTASSPLTFTPPPTPPITPPIQQTPQAVPESPSLSKETIESTPFEAELAYGKLTTTIPYPSYKKTVYLTFDDGPGSNTKRIVEILDKNKIIGSFFWVGDNLASWLKHDDSSQSFIQEMLKKGEVIGSHTMKHTALGHTGLDSQIHLIKESKEFISDKIGHPVVYFRPPYGSVDQNTPKAAEETKQIITYWQADSEDWKYPHNPDKVLNNIMSEVGPGAIILLHEKSTTADMLQGIIDALKEKGYHFAPLPHPKP